MREFYGTKLRTRTASWYCTIPASSGTIGGNAKEKRRRDKGPNFDQSRTGNTSKIGNGCIGNHSSYLVGTAYLILSAGQLVHVETSRVI